MLIKGADRNIKDQQGRTPLDLVSDELMDSIHDELIRILGPQPRDQIQRRDL
jgi:ankyrin repeat protein